MQRLFARLSVLSLFALSSLATASVWGGDWAAWRGPYQDGVSLETGLTSSTKDILWRIPCGSHSTPVIFHGRVYIDHLTGHGISEQEEILCVDAATGKDLWHYRFNCFHTDVADSRVGWAGPTVDPATGNVYTNGVQGLVQCFDRDGKLLWSRSTCELDGRVSGYGGRTYTPVIDEDRVIVAFNNSSFGRLAPGAHRLLALDKRTGDIVWWSTPGGRPEDPTYSDPVVAVIGGERLVIAGNADGHLYAVKARTGEKVWDFHASRRGLNVTPVVEGYRVYCSHSEENLDSLKMGRVVCLDGRMKGVIPAGAELWRCDGIEAGFASPLVHGGRIYVMTNSGRLYCLDAVSGKQYWKFKAGRIGKGSPVWADGKIYLTTADGYFVILKDAGDECKKVDSLNFNAGDEKGIEIFSSPAVSDGRIVVTTATEMVCFGNKDAGREAEMRRFQDEFVKKVGDKEFQAQAVAARQSGSDSVLPSEAPTESTPADLMLRPAEVVLRPGETVEFHAIAYDKHGRRIGAAEGAHFLPPKLGKLDGQGRFTAGKHAGIGELQAELDLPSGKLTGAARIRVVPDLPISEDFESYKDGDVIGWWVGATKAKYVITTLDGSKVLKKISNDLGPMLNRTMAFITPPLPAGYTVESDVRGVEKDELGPNGTVIRRGDAGVVNARYVMELCENGSKLRIVSWVPMLRFEKSVPFTWPRDKWYRVKLKVEIVDGEAKVYGKAWPRDEAEPAQWTIEGSDPVPNIEGAAGVYANSTNADVFFDNVKVHK